MRALKTAIAPVTPEFQIQASRSRGIALHNAGPEQAGQRDLPAFEVNHRTPALGTAGIPPEVRLQFELSAARKGQVGFELMTRPGIAQLCVDIAELLRGSAGESVIKSNFTLFQPDARRECKQPRTAAAAAAEGIQSADCERSVRVARGQQADPGENHLPGLKRKLAQALQNCQVDPDFRQFQCVVRSSGHIDLHRTEHQFRSQTLPAGRKSADTHRALHQLACPLLEFRPVVADGGCQQTQTADQHCTHNDQHQQQLQ